MAAARLVALTGRCSHWTGSGARRAIRPEGELTLSSSTDAFATIRRARTLRERHPDAPASAVLVALVLASYANGKSGTSIRPGLERVAEETGLALSSVRRHVAWLENRGELRRDKQGHRGSAACFTYVGGKALTSEPHSEKGARQEHERRSPVSPHQPDQPTPSEPSGSSGIRCELCGGETEIETEPDGWRVASCATGCCWHVHVARSQRHDDRRADSGKTVGREGAQEADAPVKAPEAP